VRRAADRAILSSAKPAAVWRLARYLGASRERCDCARCMTALVEWCARRMVTETKERT